MSTTIFLRCGPRKMPFLDNPDDDQGRLLTIISSKRTWESGVPGLTICQLPSETSSSDKIHKVGRRLQTLYRRIEIGCQIRSIPDLFSGRYLNPDYKKRCLEVVQAFVPRQSSMTFCISRYSRILFLRDVNSGLALSLGLSHGTSMTLYMVDGLFVRTTTLSDR